MATIRCWALHGNVNNAIFYILDAKDDGKKCEQKYYESTNGNPFTSGYLWKTSNESENSKNKIVGFHFQQSFEPGSISKEEAFEISKKWIEEITKGEYDYVIALHTDKKSIHSHIIVNPVNKNTGKQMQLFYKRDIPKFKAISDRICKEHGLKTLEGKEYSYGKSYYEWMKENSGDSLKTIVSKTLDNVIEKVTSFEELKTYLNLLGYEIEDGSEINQEDEFVFTGDIKLVDEARDSYTSVRMPYTKNFMHIKNEDMKWIKKNKTFMVSFKNNQTINIYDKNGQLINQMKAEELNLFWEKKDKTRKRNGLRIKIPGSKVFIRCNRIHKNEKGEGYSMEEIIERIANNGRLRCDPDIEEFIKKNLSDSDRKKERERFYDDADIKTKWKNSKFYKSTKKERYVAWKTKQIQNRIDKIHENKNAINDYFNINDLQKSYENLKKDFKNVCDEIRKQEATLEEIQFQKMENRLDITQEEIEEFITENIKPLYKTKKELSEEIKKMEIRIKNTKSKEKEMKKGKER